MWLFKSLTEGMAEAINGFLLLVGSIMNEIFNFCLVVNQVPMIETIMKYTTVLALAMLGIMAVKSGLAIYGLESEGDPEQSPMELIYRLAMAVCFIGSSSWIYSTTWKIINLIANDVLGLTAEYDFVTSMTTNVAAWVAQGSQLSLALIWVAAVTLVFLVVLCVIAAKRGAELALMKFMMPLFGIDFLNTDREKIKTFLTSFGITFGGYVIQIILYKLFCYNMINVHTNSATNSLAALGCLIVAVSTPKWLEKMLYSSGAGNGIKGGARTALYIAPQLLR
ncbi:MAG: DUF6102 family protein [Lachnospiraceae bacterium]